MKFSFQLGEKFRLMLLVVALARISFLQGELPLSLLDKWTINSWTVEDGLPESEVRGLAFAPNGFLWVCTTRRLCRFDGVRFEVIDSDKMPNFGEEVRLNGLLWNPNGELWIFGTGGAWRCSQGKWQAYFTEINPATGRSFEVLRVLYGHHGTVWLLTPQNLYSLISGQLSAYPIPKNLPGWIKFCDMALEPTGKIWIAAYSCVLSFENSQFSQSPLPKPLDSQRQANFIKIQIDHRGRVYTADNHTLFLWNGERWDHLSTPKRGEVVLPGALAISTEDSVWIASEVGLHLREAEGVWYRAYLEDVDQPLNCRDIGLHKDGTIWVGTASGLCRVTKKLSQTFQVGQGSGQQKVSMLRVRTDGTVQAGLVKGGLFKFKDQKFVPESPDLVVSNVCISTMIQTDDEELWMGTNGRYLYQKKDRGWNVVQGEGINPFGSIINALQAQSNGDHLAGTGEGLMRTNRRSNGSYGLVPDFGPKASVAAIHKDSDGTIWVGYQDQGLAVRSPQGTVQRWQEPQDIPGRGINAFWRDSEGLLWLGGSDGLACWKGSTNKTIFSNLGGWNLSGIKSLTVDAMDYLWLSSESGLLRVDRSLLANSTPESARECPVRHLEINDRGQRPWVTVNTIYEGAVPPKQLWWGTDRGIVSIDSGCIPHHLTPAQVFLESIQVDGQNIWLRPTWTVTSDEEQKISPRVELAYHSRNLRIRLTALDYLALEHVQFRYGWADSPDKWSDFTINRILHFDWLPTGTHTLAIESLSADGGRWKNTLALTVQVLPPFWKTLWFRLLISLMIILMIIVIVRIKLRRIFQRNKLAMEQERKIFDERERIARDLHDELGSGLSHIALLSELAKEVPRLPEAVVNRLEHIYNDAAALVRKVEEIVWTVNPANDDAGRCLEYLLHWAEEFLHSADISVRIKLPQDLAVFTLRSHVRHNIYLAMREILTNILKHAKATIVTIEVEMGSSRLNITIVDNGCGFQVDQAEGPVHGHNGLHNISHRLKDINGDVQVFSELGQGTKFCLSLPMFQQPRS